MEVIIVGFLLNKPEKAHSQDQFGLLVGQSTQEVRKGP